ncbi:uncharacterized protein [Choristoneura fumiferana]|uniref:uncharacterized protein n=1 Tax=Choristoneura fumiferana TaxID=7141 RepID=UPI003D153E15
MSAEGECEGEPVDLYIYDLTQGLAAILSPAIMGRQVEGVWHTSLVVFRGEYYYGGGGVACAPIVVPPPPPPPTTQHFVQSRGCTYSLKRGRIHRLFLHYYPLSGCTV